MSKFKIGDLVMVKEGTHDEKMPDNRIGLIVEETGCATVRAAH